MRLALLYARTRGVPSAGVALLILSGMGAAAGHWLATRASLDPATARVPVMVALAVAVAVVLVGTLHSPTDEIERTTPRRWASWRTGHALTATAVGALLTAPVLPATTYGQTSLLRNTSGLFGLALLSAVIFGPRLGWLLPVGYAATIYLSARLGHEQGQCVWAFIMQPAGSTRAMVSAGLMLVAGTAAWAYAARRPLR